jgi:TonB family protein
MAHADILDEREPMRRPLLGSLAFHMAIAAALTGGSMIRRAPENWGEPNALGGTTAVNPVARIPMPARTGEVNPVANDTDSQVPKAPPEPKPAQREPEPDPNAIAIKGRNIKKASPKTATNDRYRPYGATPKENQVFSERGGALVSPMMGTPGSGNTGIGVGSPLGDRFGAYASLLAQRIAQNWKTQDIDPRIKSAPAVIVNFTLMRDGTIRNIAVKRSSGNAAIDRSAERALYSVGKFEPLPAAYERSEAVIEFWFELKR